MAEQFLSGSIEEAAEKTRDRVMAKDDVFSAVVIGADELWEVSLLKFIIDYLQKSAPSNFYDLTQKSSTINIRAMTNSIREQSIHEKIEAEFAAAALDRSRIERLSRLLEKHGLFEEYEDKFYSLVRRLS